MNKVVGLIPMKLNNQRLPGKNTKMLGDKVLCQYLFETLQEVTNIDETYVYCSDNSVCQYIPNGINFLRRPIELDDHTVKSKDILNAFTNTVDANIYVLMHVTQPFIKAKTIAYSIEQVLSGEYDSAFAAHEIREFAWFQGQPINYKFDNVVRTQELEPLYIEGELFIFKKDVFKKYGRRIGEKPYIHPLAFDESICIDTMDDFMMAQAILEIRKNLNRIR